MERLKFLGQDERLETGKEYDCTVVRGKRANGGVNLSVHISRTGRHYKGYPTPKAFSEDWEMVRDKNNP